MLLLDAAAVIQPVLDQAGVKGDVAEAMMKIRRAERRAVTYSPGVDRPRWTKEEGIAAGLIVDALIAMAADR